MWLLEYINSLVRLALETIVLLLLLAAIFGAIWTIGQSQDTIYPPSKYGPHATPTTYIERMI